MTQYDVIVVGARVAGSPTAMLLARQGQRVLLVDRARFPSDTISTHLIHPTGIAALRRWGLLDQLVATGCPPITKYFFDFDCAVLSGVPTPSDGISTAYGPRRIVLDNLLVEAAAAAGAEVRDGYTVEEVLTDGDRVTGIRGRSGSGPAQVDTAPLVIGADGKHSIVARTMKVPAYIEKPPTTAGYYTYFSGVPFDEYRVYVRPNRAIVVVPTHDNLRLVLVGWPRSEFAENKKDLQGTYLRALNLVPELAEYVRAGTQEARITGTGDMLNAFRRPYGPGWALVGDAGYVKDPCTAQGISDSFRDAEMISKALREAAEGVPTEVALARFHQDRDKAVKPMFDLTCQLASFKPLPAFMRGLFRSMQGNQPAMDQFMGVNAGTTSPKTFFKPGNLGGIFLGAAARKIRPRPAPQPEATFAVTE